MTDQINQAETYDKAAELLAATAALYKPKCDLYYPVLVDRNGKYIQEVEDSEHDSICEDCYEKAIKYFRANRKAGAYKGTGAKGVMLDYESSPEKDDFTICTFCYEYIDVGVLHTFSQEIDHWLEYVNDEDLARHLLFPQDAWLLNELLSSLDAQEKHPDELTQLANRIIALLSK